MKEFDKVIYLEDLAVKYEIPVEQVMVAYATYCELCKVLDENAFEQTPLFHRLVERIFSV